MSSIEKALEKFKKEVEVQAASLPESSKTIVTKDNTSNPAKHIIEEDRENRVEAGKKQVQPKGYKNHKNKVHQLDFNYLSENGFIAPDSSNQTLIEEYRIIKRPVLNNAFGKTAEVIQNRNVITVVSSLPNEGKTFTSLNLALSISMEKNTTVLLVDADVTKPSLTKFLGLSNEPGLLDMLADDELDFVDVVWKTNIENLSILPAGTFKKEAAELISSDRKKRFLEEISGRYKNRIIIFDAPPLLVASHSGILVDMAGQIIFVVEEGKTRENVIREALSLIDEDKVIGMILNKTHRVMSGEYYGSYGAVPGNDK